MDPRQNYNTTKKLGPPQDAGTKNCFQQEELSKRTTGSRWTRSKMKDDDQRRKQILFSARLNSSSRLFYFRRLLTAEVTVRAETSHRGAPERRSDVTKLFPANRPADVTPDSEPETGSHRAASALGKISHKMSSIITVWLHKSSNPCHFLPLRN